MVGTNVGQSHEEREIKKVFTDALYHCMDLLHENNYFSETGNGQLSSRSKFFGEKMFEFMQSAKRNLINQRKDGPSIRSSSLNRKKPSGKKNLNEENSQKVGLIDCFIYVRPEERLAADSAAKSMIQEQEEPQVNSELDADDEEELPKRKSTRQSAPTYAEVASDDEFDCDDDNDEDYSENDNDKNSSDENEESAEENQGNSSEDNDDDSGDDQSDDNAERPTKRRKITKSPDKNNNSNEDLEEAFPSRRRKKNVAIPYETKLLVLKLERENPDWDIKTLRERSGCKQFDCRLHLRQWADYVKRAESGQLRKDKSERKKKEFVPLEMKVKVVNLAREHPDWSMRVLRERSGCTVVEKREQIRLWAKHIKSGGTKGEKNKQIYAWMYKKCLEYKEQKKSIDNRILFDWSYEGQKELFPDDPVKKPSKIRKREGFLKIFKQLYNITGQSPNLKVGKNPQDPDQSDSDDSTEENSVNNSTATRKRSRTTEKSMPLKKVPYEYRVKMVNLAIKNPTWSVKQINSAVGCNYAHTKSQIRSWAKALQSGGSVRDKMAAHNRWIYEKCLEYSRLNKKISNEVLLKWSAEAHKVESMRYNPTPDFEGSDKWLVVFRKEFNIIGRSPNLEVGERRKNTGENSGDVGTSCSSGVADNSGSNEDDDDVDVENENEIIDCSSIKEYLKKRQQVFIPYEKKKKVLELYRKNPTWTLEKLRQQSGLESMNLVKLNRWIRHLKSNGSKHDKMRIINRLVYEKCLEYKKNNKFLNNNLLKEWALEAKNKYLSDGSDEFVFNASLGWMTFFKETHGITGQSPQLVVNDLPVDENSDESDSDDEEESSDEENVSIQSMKYKKPRTKRLPLDKMMEVVNLAHKNPKWTFKELRANSGCNHLKNFDQLIRWEKIITKSNTFIDRCESMNKWVYDQCTEYKKKKYTITDKIIVGWALEAKRIFDNLGTKNFGTLLWLNNFKVKYKISGESSD